MFFLRFAAFSKFSVRECLTYLFANHCVKALKLVRLKGSLLFKNSGGQLAHPSQIIKGMIHHKCDVQRAQRKLLRTDLMGYALFAGRIRDELVGPVLVYWGPESPALPVVLQVVFGSWPAPEKAAQPWAPHPKTRGPGNAPRFDVGELNPGSSVCQGLRCSPQILVQETP